ncbi:MAG: lysylphosphatidylglycerol synthase transmembrane domain-containing protein [Terriglobales bacterium]
MASLSASPPQRRPIPSWLPQAILYCLSAACLVWVLHGYPLRDLVTAIATLDFRWVLLAVAFDLSVYVCHAWRWNTLLGPVVRLRLWRTVQAVYIGLFANELLPLRTGEVIRCYLLAHWNNFRISLSLSSAAVERLMDGLWMMAAFAVTAGFVRGIPGDLTMLVRVLAALLLAAAGGFLWVVWHKQDVHAAIGQGRWASTLRHVVEGLHLMGGLPTLTKTMLLSLLYLALQIATVWALMKAYGLDLSFWAAGGVLTVVRLGTVVPNAPGNLGLFQVACVVALGLFDVEKNDAKTFSFIMFFSLTVPLLIGGAIATALARLNLGELHLRAARTARAAHREAQP